VDRYLTDLLSQSGLAPQTLNLSGLAVQQTSSFTGTSLTAPATGSSSQQQGSQQGAGATGSSAAGVDVNSLPALTAGDVYAYTADVTVQGSMDSFYGLLDSVSSVPWLTLTSYGYQPAGNDQGSFNLTFDIYVMPNGGAQLPQADQG
jgi:hypothetical protein